MRINEERNVTKFNSHTRFVFKHVLSVSTQSKCRYANHFIFHLTAIMKNGIDDEERSDIQPVTGQKTSWNSLALRKAVRTLNLIVL